MILALTGNHKQETTTGKQLFNKYGDLNYPDNTSYANATTLLSNGTLKSNSNSNSNASKGARLTGLKANTIYTVKGKIKSMTHNVRIRVMGYSTNWKAIVEPIFTSIGDFKFTFNTSSEYSDFFLSLNGYYNDSTTITEAIFDEVMVYEGTDDISYEKYTGGMESPSVKYPSKIEIIDGCNIFDGEIELGWIDRENGELLVDDNKTRSKNFIPVKPNTEYTFTRESGVYRWIVGYTKEKVGITDGNWSGAKAGLKSTANESIKTLTFTTSPTTYYIKWYDSSCTNLSEKVAITEGTEEKPYLPYNSIGLKFSGKNKIGINDIEVNNLEIADGQEFNQNAFARTKFIEVKKSNNYSLSIFDKINFRTSILHFYDKNKQHISYIGGNAGFQNFITPENCSYIRATFAIVNGSTYTNFDENGALKLLSENIQLEEGEGTTYEPYHEPQLIPIGLDGNSIAKVNDLIKDGLSVYYRNGKVILTKKVNRYIFTGNEGWTKDGNADIDVDYFYLLKNNTPIKNAISNTFIKGDSLKEGIWENSEVFAITINKQQTNITSNDDKQTRIEKFKQWLKEQYDNGTTVYVDYELATSQTIQLPSIEPLSLWKGIVNVELISNLSSNLEVKYNIVPAMPSLEAKSDLESVGDNGEVNIKQQNKNLWNIKEDITGINVNTEDNKTFILNTDTIRHKYTIDGKKNKAYYVQFTLQAENGGDIEFMWIYNDNTSASFFYKNQSSKINEKIKAKSLADKTVIGIELNTYSVARYTQYTLIEPSITEDDDEYEEHKEVNHQMALGKPLRGIKTNDSTKANYIDENGNYWITDYIDDDGIHRKIGKETINITSQLFTLSNGNKVALITPTNKWKTYITGVKTSMFTKAIYADRASKDFGLTGTYYENEGNFIIVGDKNDTVETMQEKYNGETLLYILNEEIIEEFTEEEKKSWNEFKKLKTFKGKNYINSTDEIQAGLEFSYKKDNRISTQKELEKCNERLNNIENLLNTTETSALLLDNLENDLKKEVE